MKSPINVQLLSSLLVVVLLGLVRKIEAVGLTLTFESSPSTNPAGFGSAMYNFPNPIPLFGQNVSSFNFRDTTVIEVEGGNRYFYVGFAFNSINCSVTLGPVDSSSRTTITQELAQYEGATPISFALMAQWTYPGSTFEVTTVWATDFTETYFMVWHPVIDTNIDAQWYLYGYDEFPDTKYRWDPEVIDDDILVLKVTDQVYERVQVTSTTTTTPSRNSASQLSSTHTWLSIAISLLFAALVL